MHRKQPLPKSVECIAYIESSGWTFSHRSVIRTYVFTKKSDRAHHAGEVAFTLRELRDAFRDGW